VKRKIEVQILSPATKEQLIELRNEIRKVEGMEAFDLHLPPAPLTPGKMDGGASLIILEAVISGLTHFTADKTIEYYQEKINGLIQRMFGNSPVEAVSEREEMNSGAKSAAGKYSVAVSDTMNGVKSVTSYDDTGSATLYNNREYSIDPEHTYAILIGTSEYDDRANFSPIPPVAGNIDSMYRILSDRTLVGIPYENITRLYNESCINIKDELRAISRTQNIKTLIIYYSGHGQNTGNNTLSLIAKDTRTIDEELHNDIPYSFVEKMMNSSQADQKIVFIDACHSGLAAQGNSNIFDFEPVQGTFTLASTSADDSSYFKRNDENTYFTSYLADAFQQGIKSGSKMLSLNDLYTYTSQKLQKARLPAPVCKSQLKNIIADKFYISGNPSFSLEARLNYPKQLYQQGKYEEARREFILLEKEYPDNLQLRNEHIEFERNTEFNRLVKEGDSLFFREKKLKAAQEKYREALIIKDDENIRDKIADCERSLSDSGGYQRTEEKPIYKGPEQNKGNTVYNKPQPVPPIHKKSRKPIIIGAVLVLAVSLLYTFLKKKEVHKLTDGDLHYDYVGGFSDEKPNGDGKATYTDNGTVYEGQWRDGKQNGFGTFTYKNGNTYKGYLKDGLFDGQGTYTYKDGNIYEGNWTKMVFQGRNAIVKYSNGNKYVGDWYNGDANGRGKFTWSGGTTYEGQFKNGLKQGTGVLISPNSDLYYCKNCRKYYGSFRNDVKDGQGTCYDINNNIIYNGNFSNDKPTGNYPDN
jgi:tetratricopeptide (TPR) repeat protein